MKEKSVSISQRENYVPSQWDEILWWLSTAEKEILVDCVVDRNRYRIIGMTVLATWAFATLAWTYFFSTVMDNPFLVIGLGLFMGFVILTIDRALIKGINRSNKNKITPLLFRGALALTIGTFMAQPALLYIFDKDIKAQVSLDHEKRKQAKLAALETLYKDRKDELVKEKTALQTQLKQKDDKVSQARENFIREADGTGGTGKVGIKDIALAKRNEYQKLDQEYAQMQSAAKPKIEELDKQLNEIETSIKKEEDNFNAVLDNGFLTRIEALNNLTKNSPALQSRYYLILIILMLIELMPVIAKTMLPAGAYDEKVMLREEMEREIAHSNIAHEKELKELYNKMAKEADTETIYEFFQHSKEKRGEKLKTMMEEWQSNPEHSLDGFWGRAKKNIITKQEN